MKTNCLRNQRMRFVRKRMNLYCLVVMTGLSLSSCTTSFLGDDSYLDNGLQSSESAHGIISVDEAIKIADGTRTEMTRSQGNVSVDYVLRDINRQSLNKPSQSNDTLAYIINYPENTGFAIIAADERVPSVLAQSDCGCFSKTDELVKENFLNKLEYYVDLKCSEPASKVNEDPSLDNNMPPYVYVPHIIDAKLHQGDPFNKYVLQYKHCSAVGCTPIAVTYLLSYCADSLTFKGQYYDFDLIMKKIAAGPPSINPGVFPPIGKPSSGALNIAPPGGTMVMTYSIAADRIARLLYDMGGIQDLRVYYDTINNRAGASLYNAHQFIGKMGYEVSPYSKFNLKAVIDYLLDGHLIGVSGYNGEKINKDEIIESREGHAWVIEGMQGSFDRVTREILYNDALLWCNWGWNGSCNGYYRGDVIAVAQYNFELSHYFAVKKKGRYAQ